MARHKASLHGRIGNVIFYEHRGIPCSRRIPAKVRQTKATKEKAVQFGQASCMSAQLRSGLKDVLDDTKARPMMYNLRYALQCWINEHEPDERTLTTELPFIDQFSFSEKTSLKERLKKTLSVEWAEPDKIILRIPELVPDEHIRAPAGTSAVHWKIGAVSCTTGKRPSLTGNTTTAFKHDYHGKPIPSRQVDLTLGIKKGELIILVVALQFSSMRGRTEKFITDKKWSPADVVGCCYKK